MKRENRTLINRLMKYIILPLFVCLISAGARSQPFGTDFQPVTLPYGKIIDWHSRIVSDSFRTYVFLPSGYDTSRALYPVLYLTDGDWVFTTAVNVFGSLKQDYFVREPVIIAIGYGNRQNRRDRDLDPDKGGAAFLRSLKDELMPWVKQQFRISDDQALYGYSMGGKFATFALFSEPRLFSSVLIGAPADGGIHIMPTARKFMGNISSIRSKIFMGTGGYEPETVYNIKKFREWGLQQSPVIDVATYVAPQMNHGAAIPAVLQEALRITYADWHKAIMLPRTTLQQYAGLYRSTADTSVYNGIHVKNGKLYILLHGYENDYPIEMHAVSPTQFFLKEFEKLIYTFRSPGRLTIRFPNGDVMEMKKTFSRPVSR